MVLLQGPACSAVVQQLLGHSSITVTMRYTHTNLDAQAKRDAKTGRFW
jgi:site-specific recombinase XerD